MARKPQITMQSLPKIEVQLSKTADGSGYFLQIRSPTTMPVNIVLIAEEIELRDDR